METTAAVNVSSMVQNFVAWLEDYGEESQDWQDFYAGDLGRKSKSLYYRNKLFGTIGVAPIVFLEMFFPQTRRFFYPKTRFPIADAHFAMGYAFLFLTTGQAHFKKRAIHFINILEKSRCAGFQDYCWGYPFDWETVNGTIKAGTPLITTIPYVYEAFLQVYDIHDDDRYLAIARSIAEHAYCDYRDIKIDDGVYSCGYQPEDSLGMVVNASAYRAFLLVDASIRFSEDRFLEKALGNIQFVQKSQNEDGSWYYAVDSRRSFIDHFHTCFVLKSLIKINELLKRKDILVTIEKGIDYYTANLFDQHGLPLPFSKPPRITVYRRELYDFAECINLMELYRTYSDRLTTFLHNVLSDLNRRWQKADGSFRSRRLFIGWDNLPMHRWAQSQLFRSLAFYQWQQKKR